MSFTVTPKDAAAPNSISTPNKADRPLTARDRAMKIMLGESLNAPPQDAAAAFAEAVAKPVETPAEADAPAPTGENSPPVVGSTDAPAVTPVSDAAAKPEEPISAQYAQLARKEKALRAEAMKLKQERDAWKREQESASRPAPTQSQQQSFDPSKYVDKEMFARDPHRALMEAGLTYDQFTQAVLTSPSSPTEVALQSTISKLEAKIQALEETTTKTQKSFEDREQQSYQQALTQIEREAKALADSDPAFEMIKATGSHKDVRDLIETVWKEEQRLMTVEEASKLVEDTLIEEYLKYSTVGKIKQRLQPAAQASAPQAPNATQSQPKTLTNAVAGSVKMTNRQRAEAAFRGEKL